jgi:hypothetical protein
MRRACSQHSGVKLASVAARSEIYPIGGMEENLTQEGVTDTPRPQTYVELQHKHVQLIVPAYQEQGALRITQGD